MDTTPSTPDTPRVIAYSRVSTDEQARSGLGLAAQREALAAEAARRGWTDVEWITDDGYSAGTLRRPGIARALTALAAGDADVLVAAKLDRLSRSLLDFAGLMERSRREGWQLVVLDVAVDTTTAAGELMASVMASFSQFERRLIGERTAAALATLRASGARLGRPRELPDDVVARVVAERAAGASLRAIARTLDAEGVPTAHGGSRWYASTVGGVLRSAQLDAEAATAEAAA